MCDYNPDVQGYIFEDKLVIAAKPYRCYECNRVIDVGQRFSKIAGRTEGYFFKAQVCMRCYKARKWLENMGHSWLIGDGEMLDQVRQCAEEDKVEIIAKAKAKKVSR